MLTKKKKKVDKTSTNFQELLKEIKNSDSYEVEVVRDSISEQIFQLMQTKRISKAELARRLNTSTPYITKLLQGNGNFTLETLVKIARAFECKFVPRFSLSELLWQDSGEFSTKTSVARIKPSEANNAEYTESNKDYSANKLKIEGSNDKGNTAATSQPRTDKP